ncbi:hypothetical protein HQ560_01540, partial [bacterium]|nr:hypothetical protein [bacterium]
MLAWTTQRPTVAAPIIDGSAEGGLGFFRVTANPDGDDTGEFVKYAKAGIALVWRYHPDDVAAGSADPPLPQEQWRKIAWYIGYLADLGGEDVDGNPTGNGQRACFETTKVDIVEGAKIKLDCVKLVQDGKLWNLPRGHQEEITWTYTQFGEPDDIQRISKLNGQGIFQLYTAIDAYEWVQFTYPQWTALPGNPDAATEIALVDSRWLVGISRNSGGTTARDWAPGTPLMPVFFGTSVMSYNDNNNTPVRKGKGDTVTLTDLTHQRETRTLSHGSGHYFAFRQHVVQAFEYA